MTVVGGWVAVLIFLAVFVYGRGMTPVERPVRIGAFNIQVFGRTKMDKTNVVKTLIKILQRYDITLVQEIRDSSETALPLLVEQLNKEQRKDKNGEYKFVVSEKLGRSISKEQYGFIYKKDMFDLDSTYQYKDPNDVFEREPFACRFKSHTTEISDFGIIAIHTSPKSAVEELNALTAVYDELSLQWNLEDIMIAGDFNADCTYVSRKEERKEISLFTDKRFEWLIGADLDTTVGDSDCSYDRFVVAGRNLKSAILPGTVGVYNFHKKHNLTAEEAKEVSDHYPIELSLQGREHTQVTEGKRVSLGLGFTESNQVDKDGIQKLYTSREDLEDIGFTVRRYKEENRNELYVVTKTCKNRLEVLLDLYSFRIANSRKSFENLITKEQLAMVEQFLISDYSDILKPPPHVNGLSTKVDDNFTVEIRCRISETKCELYIKRLIF